MSPTTTSKPLWKQALDRHGGSHERMARALIEGEAPAKTRWPRLSSNVAIAFGIACVLVISGWGWTNNQLASQLQDSQDNEQVLSADLQESLNQERQLRREAEELEVTLNAAARDVLQRGHEELLRIREEAPDNVAGEPFAAMRYAGEILRIGGIEDPEFWDRYGQATDEILTQLAQYLHPDQDVTVTVELGPR